MCMPGNTSSLSSPPMTHDLTMPPYRLNERKDVGLYFEFGISLYLFKRVNRSGCISVVKYVPSRCKALGSIPGTAKNKSTRGLIRISSAFQTVILSFQPLSYIHILNLYWLYLKLHDFSLISLSHSPVAVIKRPLHSQASASPCPKRMTRTGHILFHTWHCHLHFYTPWQLLVPRLVPWEYQQKP